MTNQCIAGACLGSTGFSYTLSLINGKYKMNILYEKVHWHHIL